MKSLIERNDRRKFRRHHVNDGARIIFNLDYKIHGQIINISQGGLSFCYVNTKDLKISGLETDVYLDNNGKFIAKLACKVIWDRKVSYSSTKGHDLIRECGIRFQDCSPNQIAQLNTFFNRDLVELKEYGLSN